jgi:hypothetical protein
VGASVGGLAACELIDDVLGYLSKLDLLGVVPASGYSNPGSPDYGKVTFTLTGRDDLGGAVAPLLSELEVVDDGGTPVKSDGGQEVPGNTVGSFLLVADGSGSTEADFYCSGCPTDPDRIRVEAVRALALQLDDCDWRMSLVEFGRDPYPAVRPNAVVADWTMDGEELAAAAEGLSSGWTTPLWDAVLHGLERLDDDNQQSYEFPAKAGRGIVIVSDGVDTASSHTLNDAVEGRRRARVARAHGRVRARVRHRRPGRQRRRRGPPQARRGHRRHLRLRVRRRRPAPAGRGHRRGDVRRVHADRRPLRRAGPLGHPGHGLRAAQVAAGVRRPVHVPRAPDPDAQGGRGLGLRATPAGPSGTATTRRPPPPGGARWSRRPR